MIMSTGIHFKQLFAGLSLSRKLTSAFTDVYREAQMSDTGLLTHEEFI
jgi:hypothetical protein